MTFFPNLRFPGFEGEWEVRKMGDIANKIGDGLHGTPDYTDGSDYYFINGNNLINGKIEIYENTKKVSVSTFLKNDKNLKENTLLISINGTIGSIAKYNNEKIMLGKSVGYFNFNNNSDFIYFTLHTKSIQDYFVSELTGSTIKNLSLKTLRETNIYLPSSEEQSKISHFLSLIDNRIQTQKKIIEDLIILKSNTAQNIFNQVFKFKDSEGIGFPNWQIKKLGDVCEIKRGASPRPISDSKWFDEDSKIGWVRISDVTKSEKYLEKTEQYLSDAGISKSRLVKKGNMIMSICATIGKPIYTNFDVCIHDGFVVFENLTLNKEFLYYYLDFIQLNWYKYGQPGIQVNLNSEIVNNESVVVPVIEEQIKIAEFLSKFDEKIKLENELLTQYENQKKYLLKNLFV